MSGQIDFESDFMFLAVTFKFIFPCTLLLILYLVNCTIVYSSALLENKNCDFTGGCQQKKYFLFYESISIFL